MEKLHQQLCAPDAHRGFSSNQDVVLRLVPYHVWAEPELPPGAVEKGEQQARKMIYFMSLSSSFLFSLFSLSSLCHC